MFLATSGIPMSDRSDFSIIWDTIGLIILTVGGISIGVLLLAYIIWRTSRKKWFKNNEHRKVPCPHGSERGNDDDNSTASHKSDNHCEESCECGRPCPCPPYPSNRPSFPLLPFGGLLTPFALVVLFMPNGDLVRKHNIDLATEHYGVTLNDGYKKKERKTGIEFPEPGRFIPLGSIILDNDQQILIKTAYLERSEDDILTISTTGEDGITLIPLPVQN